MPELFDRLQFFLATDALKETRRANWIFTSARFETVAEHTWHTLLLAMLLADAAPEGIDHNHVRDLLIVHDLVEVYAGDTPVWDDALRATEAEREAAAGERLMAMLPDDIFPQFDPLWREYQAQETPESRFARAIDSLHPVLMAWAEGAHGHALKDITPTRLLERKRPTIERYPALWELVIRIVQDAVDRGALPPDDLIKRRTDAADS
jgi:putative hydrolases of HD superfamily